MLNVLLGKHWQEPFSSHAAMFLYLQEGAVQKIAGGNGDMAILEG